jgi:hypothetical protein
MIYNEKLFFSTILDSLKCNFRYILLQYWDVVQYCDVFLVLCRILLCFRYRMSNKRLKMFVFNLLVGTKISTKMLGSRKLIMKKNCEGVQKEKSILMT